MESFQMVAKTIDIHEAKAHLPELLGLAISGTEVIIVAGDKPLARLSPAGLPVSERIAGLNEGAIWTSDDFDEPLPDEFWLGSA